MSYQVLARKWRPQNFSQLVGQEHVQKALVNALENQRLHHAYLFTGTRGVGKTTIARILARSLNCETGITATPCGECSACREIADGRFVDLIEVDAASRTKVEDTRELLENVQYAPTKGRFKVYLIDEVHMLSNHSFNALLKTLEEPPPHVKFLLATTDPQRLPVTILSRCLQFHLKRLSVEQIQQHLQSILDQESIQYDQASLVLIAHAADGSIRDALSLLDQAIAFAAEKLMEADIRTMLGAIDHAEIMGLLQAVAEMNAEQVFSLVAAMADHAINFEQVLADVLSALHQVAMMQIAPAVIDSNHAHFAELKTIAESLSPEDVQLFYQIGLIGRRDLSLAPDPRLGFEMVMLRMLAFKPAEYADTDNVASATQQASTTGTNSSMQSIRDSLKKKHKNPELDSPRNILREAHGPNATTPQAPSNTPLSPAAKVKQRLKQAATDGAPARDAEPVPASKTNVAPDPATMALNAAVNAQAAGALIGRDAGDTSSTGTAPVVEPAMRAQIDKASADAGTASTQVEGNPPDLDHPAAQTPAPVPEPALQWEKLVEQLDISGMPRQLAMNSVLAERDADKLALQIGASHRHFLNENRRASLEHALTEVLQQPVKLQIDVLERDVGNTPALLQQQRAEERLNAATSDINNDPAVQQLKDHFGATITPGSIQPID